MYIGAITASYFETVNDAFFIYTRICTFFMCINLLSQCSYLHLSLSWLSSFGNSLTHQYKSVSALPTVRYTTILATLYMSVKILRVFMVSPLISPIPISSENAIHLS